MTSWIIERYGRGAVPWFYFTAAILVAVAGGVATTIFAVTGVHWALAISIPTILVGGIGTLVSGLILEDHRYI